MQGKKNRKKIIVAIGVLTIATFLIIAGAIAVTTVMKDGLYQTAYDAKRDVFRDTVENTKKHIDNMRIQLKGLNPDWTEEQIKDEVTESLRDFIYDLNYVDDSYMWVQEIRNFDGGDKYAVRLIHPNLKDTEGTLLSTFTTDSQGNKPYQEELDGIKKDGNVFLTYSFKELNSDRESMKLTYSSLYPDYNWIISRGVSLNRLDESVEKVRSVETPVIIIILAIYGISVIVILIYAILLSHRSAELEDIKKNLSSELDVSKKANKAKINFLFSVSHDIRGQMDEVIKYTNLAAENVDDKDKLSEYLEKTKEAEDYMNTMFIDAGEMAFIETDDLEVQESLVNIRKNAKNIKGVIPGLIGDKDVKVVIQGNDIEHYDVYADEIRLRQITMLLLNNAIRYSREGDVIHASLTEVPSKKEGYARYRLVVEDEGAGFSEEMLKHIFDVIDNDKSSEGVESRNTRFSLSVCKRIVESIDGEISVESRLGKGTKATVEIPLRIGD